jgi:hypothetical protein
MNRILKIKVCLFACVILSCKDKKSEFSQNASINVDTVSLPATTAKDPLVTADSVVFEKPKPVAANSEKLTEKINPSTYVKTETKSVKPRVKKAEPPNLEVPQKKQEYPVEPTSNSNTVKPDKPLDIVEGPPIKKEVITLKTFDHSVFDQELRKYVDKNGKVNYANWLKNRTALDSYVEYLSNSVPTGDATLAEKMAYWINAYNANTIILILDNYPVASINKIDGGKPWDRRFIKSGNNFYTLNDIENKILRKMGDPRIHFAVNCAAKSCPKLLNKAYTASNLESSLSANTKAFLLKNEFSVTKDKLILSKIFEWYNEDFEDLRNWISTQTGIEVSNDAKISYKDYDWGLNQ